MAPRWRIQRIGTKGQLKMAQIISRQPLTDKSGDRNEPALWPPIAPLSAFTLIQLRIPFLDLRANTVI